MFNCRVMFGSLLHLCGSDTLLCVVSPGRDIYFTCHMTPQDHSADMSLHVYGCELLAVCHLPIVIKQPRPKHTIVICERQRCCSTDLKTTVTMP